MYQFQCPKCKRDCYSADEYSFLPCPNCGNKFSGVYGNERRNYERKESDTQLSVTLQENIYTANVLNLSQEGLCIKAHDNAPVTVGETLSLSFEDRQIIAKVVWDTKDGEICLLGLQRMN
jgi:hypothetical protein